MAQAETDSSMRSQAGQRSPPLSEQCFRLTRCVTCTPLSPSPCRSLPCSGRVSRRGLHASSDQLRAMRLAGRTLQLRKVLHHLQRPAQRPPLLRWSLLLPRLPGSLRRLSGQHPWPLNPRQSGCSSMPTPVWRPRPEAWSAFLPTLRDSRTPPPPDCNPPSSLLARKLSCI